MRRVPWRLALGGAGLALALGAALPVLMSGSTSPLAGAPQPSSPSPVGTVQLTGGNASPAPQAASVGTDYSTDATLASGAFVIGDQNAAMGSSVTFWGAQWWKQNSLSGGSAPASFKGFADTTANPPTCGQDWSSAPGNSSSPPSSIPRYMEVIVSSTIGKSGPTISGDTAEVVVVETDPGYEGDPGHPGTGTVVAILCGGSGGTGGTGGTAGPSS